ncbi:unnamed protein product [Effrenium voratum]|nr:unnamed protein product [Effrenium voratum]
MFAENLGEWSFVADELDLHEEEGWAWCRFQVSEPSPRLLLARVALSPEELVGSFEEWIIELPPQAPATPAFRGAPLTPPPLQAAPSPGRAGFAATPPLAFKEAAPRTPDFPVRRAAARPQKRQKKAVPATLGFAGFAPRTPHLGQALATPRYPVPETPQEADADSLEAARVFLAERGGTAPLSMLAGSFRVKKGQLLAAGFTLTPKPNANGDYDVRDPSTVPFSFEGVGPTSAKGFARGSLARAMERQAPNLAAPAETGQPPAASSRKRKRKPSAGQVKQEETHRRDWSRRGAFRQCQAGLQQAPERGEGREVLRRTGGGSWNAFCPTMGRCL